MQRNIISKRYVTYYEAKSMVQARISDSANLNVIQERTWEYLKTFGNKDSQLASELVKRIKDEAKILESTAAIILNICPNEIPFLLSMVSQLPEEKKRVIDEESAKKIINIISEFCFKKD